MVGGGRGDKGAGETRGEQRRQEMMNYWNETCDPGTAADGSSFAGKLFHVLSLRRMRETSEQDEKCSLSLASQAN